MYQKITMTVRPRLWRLGALKVYAIRMMPVAKIATENLHVAFVLTFLRMQKRKHWH